LLVWRKESRQKKSGGGNGEAEIDLSFSDSRVVNKGNSSGSGSGSGNDEEGGRMEGREGESGELGWARPRREVAPNTSGSMYSKHVNKPSGQADHWQ
jgi:hypothetical protein